MSFLSSVPGGAVSSLNNGLYRPGPELDNTEKANCSLTALPVLELIGRKDASLLGALSLVNRYFYREVPHVVPLIVNHKKIGAAIWARYIGDAGVEPPIPTHLMGRIAKTNAIALLMPPTVDGKPHTPDQFDELAKDPKEGEPTGYAYYNQKIKERYGSVAVPIAYWVVIDKEVMKGSLGKLRSEQLAMARSAGGEAPTYHEMTVAAVMHFLVTGERILGEDPLRYTVCQDEPIDGWNVVVGGFGRSGLQVYSSDAYDCRIGVVVRRS